MKTAVIYWSGTGNTEAMAKAVAEGAGAECFAVSEFSGNVEDYDAIALGCLQWEQRSLRTASSSHFSQV